MISQKQRVRKDKLVERYKALGVRPDRAQILAKCVIERRGGFGLFRACGVPVVVNEAGYIGRGFFAGD